MKNIQVNYDETFIETLMDKIEKDEPTSSWKLFQMAYEAEKTTITTEFDGLISLKYLQHMRFLDHQISTANQVIEKMHGRAILADEVGLGKTIEAGLILKEYMVRGLVKKALILVPASLVSQWVNELNNKFYIPAIAHRKNYSWKDIDIMISSIDTAKRSPHREIILENDYDFILIDEAHKLKNHRTKNYEFVRALKKKYCLLLTATPVQNRLIEIFNLVSILKPGHLGNYEEFVEKYGKDRNQLKRDGLLKQLVQQVMVRHTRKNADLQQNNIKRNIETVWIDFSEEEKQVYSQLENATQSLAAFAKITFLREICSSREACYLSLQKLANQGDSSAELNEIINNIANLPHHSKAKKVVSILQAHEDEKMIIFTEYRATQVYLQWYLKQHGITSVPYRGGFKGGKKDWMRQLFKNHAQVLIATEAGGEGINLQFCNYMINYDLPWNPMRLEQRIGRIHRYGQEKDVHIYNFAVRETVEEHIMKLLYEKLHLFERVIGQLDHILAKLDIADLDSEIQSIISGSESTGELKIKLDNLTSVIHSHVDEDEKKEIGYGNI
ncbi:SNF2-related protein [Virgibacillus sp. 179-BFC.A HS]|uniref:SNF2-related protein n=1 Tax=Tigheibacillus jepli TaxID=3035914 RepID=A0ABU5CGZ8_9BACI|nr:SNF2-related protein [Virgibacillus sp. 179-BFC.A HS]MDY0405594.1 SNF2-related protein [Virgibacillus sp. 179-BFC.A HS]